MRQRGDQGHGDDHLRNDHCDRGEPQPHHAKLAWPAQQHIDDQPDNTGGKPISALSTAIVTRRKGNRRAARMAPIGKVMQEAISSALSVT